MTAAPRRARHSCRFKAALEASPGVSMGHFREGRPSLLGQLFGGGGRPDPVAAAQAADVFIALNASTVELTDLGEGFLS